MAVIGSFCSVFSIRLGSIIVGASCLIQAAVMEVGCIICLQDVRSVSHNLNEFMYEKDFLFLTSFLNSVKKNPEPYLLGTLALLAVYSFSCILLIFGALRLNMWMVMPFVGLDFLRLSFSLGSLVASMLILKKNSMDLGPLMGGCTGGGFFLLLMLYMWTCPLSLVQELLRRSRQMRAMSKDNRTMNGHTELIGPMTGVGMDRALESKLWQHNAHTARLNQRPFIHNYPTYPMYID